MAPAMTVLSIKDHFNPGRWRGHSMLCSTRALHAACRPVEGQDPPHPPSAPSPRMRGEGRGRGFLADARSALRRRGLSSAATPGESHSLHGRAGRFPCSGLPLTRLRHPLPARGERGDQSAIEDRFNEPSPRTRGEGCGRGFLADARSALLPAAEQITLPEEKKAFAEEKKALPEQKTALPEQKIALPEKKKAVRESLFALREEQITLPEQQFASSEALFAVPLMKISSTEGLLGLPESKKPCPESGCGSDVSRDALGIHCIRACLRDLRRSYRAPAGLHLTCK